LITRTDNTVFSFTDHDMPLSISGITYQPSNSYTRSAIKTDQTLAVDNLDVVGMLDDASITYQDMNNGLFDYASVQMFVVNWTNLSQGIIRLRSGWLGECVLTPTGVFKAELRGLLQAFTQQWGDLFSPLCRADLGDSKCQVNLSSYQTSGTVTGVLSRNSFTTSGLSYTPYVGVSNTVPAAESLLETVLASTTGLLPTPNAPTANFSLTNGTNYAFVAVSNSMTGSATPVGFGLSITINGGAAHNFFDGGLGIAQSSFITTVSADINAANIGITAIPYFPGGAAPNGIRLVLQNLNDQVNVEPINDTQSYLAITSFSDGYMNNGVLTWTSGLNSGVSIEVKNYYQSNSYIGLFLSMKQAIQVGDTFTLTPGCDKRRETCYFKFNNMQNFRGEPDMPGIDAVLTFPEAFQAEG
jgi:hypothetical protein